MRVKAVEDKSHWLKHIENCKTSGLNKHKYCEQQHITYHRFLYWFKKLNNKTNQFVPIKAVSPNTPKSFETLCVLELKRGHRLVVYDESALVKILSLLSE